MAWGNNNGYGGYYNNRGNRSRPRAPTWAELDKLQKRIDQLQSDSKSGNPGGNGRGSQKRETALKDVQDESSTAATRKRIANLKRMKATVDHVADKEWFEAKIAQLETELQDGIPIHTRLENAEKKVTMMEDKVTRNEQHLELAKTQLKDARDKLSSAEQELEDIREEIAAQRGAASGWSASPPSPMSLETVSRQLQQVLAVLSRAQLAPEVASQIQVAMGASPANEAMDEEVVSPQVFREAEGSTQDTVLAAMTPRVTRQAASPRRTPIQLSARFNALAPAEEEEMEQDGYSALSDSEVASFLQPRNRGSRQPFRRKRDPVAFDPYGKSSGSVR